MKVDIISVAERVRERRQSLGLSYQDLAEKTDMSKSTLQRYETGAIKNIPLDKLEILAKALQMSPEELMGWDESNDTKEFVPARKRGVKVPILGTVIAGVPVAAIQDIIGYEEITEDLAKRGEFYGLKVKGDSMYPEIKNGDILIFKAQNDCESGQIAIVSINGDEATCKKVMKSEHGITLIAFNQSVYEPTFYNNQEIEELPIRVVGVVIEVRRSFL